MSTSGRNAIRDPNAATSVLPRPCSNKGAMHQYIYTHQDLRGRPNNVMLIHNSMPLSRIALHCRCQAGRLHTCRYCPLLVPNFPPSTVMPTEPSCGIVILAVPGKRCRGLAQGDKRLSAHTCRSGPPPAPHFPPLGCPAAPVAPVAWTSSPSHCPL